MHNFSGQSFVLAFADVGEIASMRRARGEFVEVHRNADLFSDALTEASGEIGAFVHGHFRDGDERDDVDCAEARVRAAMRRHVDQLVPFLNETNVITVRFVSAPGSTLSSVTPFTDAAAAATAS